MRTHVRRIRLNGALLECVLVGSCFGRVPAMPPMHYAGTRVRTPPFGFEIIAYVVHTFKDLTNLCFVLGVLVSDNRYLSNLPLFAHFQECYHVRYHG